MAGEQRQKNGGGSEGEALEHDDFGGASDDEVAEARAQGWKPKAELPDGKKWVDAKTFVSRGRQFNSRLQQQVESLTAQVREFEGTKKQVAKFYEDLLTRKEQEHDTAIATLRRQKIEATQNGDVDTALALEDRIDVLNSQKGELKTEAAALKKEIEAEDASLRSRNVPAREDKWPPVLKEWVADGNEWFRDDPKMAAYAVALGDEMRAAGETAVDREFLDKVKEALVAQMPNKFQNNNRQRQGPAGGRNGTGGSSKGLRDLPEADRKIAEELIAGGWTTEEAFLKSYNSR